MNIKDVLNKIAAEFQGHPVTKIKTYEFCACEYDTCSAQGTPRGRVHTCREMNRENGCSRCAS